MSEALRDDFCPVCTLQGALNLRNSESAALGILDRIGDYELIEEIARGGVGVVYKARQLSLGRVVALKVLLAGQFADPKARARFRAEAEAAARLKHPNIVTIYEVGEHDGQPFIVMEYVDGGTLAQRIAGEPLSATAAARYAVKIARAIEFAHQQGTLHRDLKPSNILIDAFDEPRVTDFGLAKQLGADSELTVTGQVLGSPSFMAPEQAAGDHAQIAAPTDVYALGAILYQLVIGRPPFQGYSTPSVLKQVERDEPLRPRRLNPSVPLDLDTVILKCLEKSPARRYASAQALADDLKRFLEDKPVLARPVGPLGRMWRWSRRNPAFATALLLLVMLALGSSIAAFWISRAERIAQQNLRLAREYSYVGDIALADRSIEEGDLARTRELLMRHVPTPGEPDLRTFEWRYLYTHTMDQSFATLTGHTHNVATVLYLPDGRLATGSSDGTVRIWNVEGRRTDIVLTNYGGRIWHLSLSGDGSRMAVCGEKGGVQVLNVDDWSETLRIRGNHLYGMALFCNDDRLIAVANRNGAALYDATTGRGWRRLENAAVPMALSSDRKLLTTRRGEMMRLWNVTNAKLLEEIRTPGLDSFDWRDLQFLPGESGWIIGSWGGAAAIVERANPTNLVRLERRLRTGSNQPHFGGTSEIAVSPDGKHFVTAGFDQQLLLWNTETRRVSRSFRGHAHEIWGVTFSPDGNWIASVGKDDLVKLWDVNARSSPVSLLRRVGGVLDAWNDRELLCEKTFTNSPQHRLVLYDWKSNRVTREIVLTNRTHSLETFWKPSLGLFGLGLTNGMVEIWNLRAEPAELVCAFQASENPIHVAELSEDGDAVVIRDWRGQFSIWDLPSGRRRVELPPHTTSLMLALNRDYLIGRAEVHVAQIIDAHTGKVLTELKGHTDDIAKGLLLPGGKKLVTIGWDGALFVWELPTGRQVAVARSQRQGLYTVALSPDGRTFAAGGQDGIVYFWNASTLQQTTRWIDRAIIRGLSFTPNGNTLIVTTAQGVRFLEAPTLAEIEQSETFRKVMAAKD